MLEGSKRHCLILKGVWYRGAIHEQLDTDLEGVILPLTFDYNGYLQTGKGERNLEILLEQLKENPEDPYILYQTSKTLWL